MELVLKNDDSSLIQQFEEISSKLFDFHHRNKLHYIKLGTAVRDRFTSLDNVGQLGILSRMKFNLKIYMELEASDFDLLEDKRASWYVINQLGVRPPSDLYSKLEDGDYVEIYDQQGIQVFRNLEFCNLTSYSLEQIISYSWDELYDRKTYIFDQIYKSFTLAFSGALNTFEPEVDEHIVTERLLNRSEQFKVKMKMFSPLLDKNNKAKYLFASSKITRVLGN